MFFNKLLPLKQVLLTSTIVCLGLIYQVPVNAEQVKMFKKVPSADEMENLMFPSSHKPKPRYKTRSIRFSEPAQQAAAPTSQHQSNAGIAQGQGIGFPIQFAYNSSEILPQSKNFLDQVGNMLNRENLQSKRIMIEGHTDASGSSQYNQQLSKKRAKAVKEYLAMHYNIGSDRLLVSGKGEHTPLPNSNPYDAANRRVQFLPVQ